MKPFDFSAGANAERATVVLLHSSASSSRQWTTLAGQLASRYDVRTVDFHGHGARPAWQGAHPLTLADEVALIEPILRSAGRVHLVGHSYGGAVALKAAHMHPHAVATVSAYEPVLFRWLFDEDVTSEASRDVVAVATTMQKYLERGDAYRAAERFLNYWSGTGTWESMSTERRHAQSTRMRAVCAQFGALTDGLPTAQELGRLGVPMLFMSGTETVASTRRINQLLRTMLPLARHKAIAGAGHLGPVTHAAQVNTIVARFVDDAQLQQVEYSAFAAE